MTNGDKSTRHREDSDPVRTRPTPSTYGAILFDFDLTLCDSSAGAVDCIQHAMETMGFAAPAEGVARATIGLSLPETFATLADDVDGASPNAERADRFATLFVERADEVMVEKARLYPGVDRTLTVLRERGYRLGVVSNKFRHRVQDICSANGIGDEFDVVVGSEDVNQPAATDVTARVDGFDQLE